MTRLLDTNVLIHLRDGSREIVGRVKPLADACAISVLTQAELEGEIHVIPRLASFRRATSDALLRTLPILPLTPAIVRAYAGILATRGFSRPRVIDRLIAATAIVHDLTLVTINADDFRDVPDLSLEVWPAPAQ